LFAPGARITSRLSPAYRSSRIGIKHNPMLIDFVNQLEDDPAADSPDRFNLPLLAEAARGLRAVPKDGSRFLFT
jgi:hypothetical protein